MQSLKIVALLFVCMAGTYCLADYSGAYTTGRADLTSNCTTSTNCAYLLKGGGLCKANSLTQGADNYMMCLGLSNSLAYHYNASTFAWDQVPAMGALQQIAAHDANDIYALYATTFCNTNYPGYYGVGHWTGTAWTTIAGGCLAPGTLTAGGNVVGGIGADGNGYIYNGTAWVIVIHSVSFLSITDEHTMCAGTIGSLWITDDGTTFHQPTQPPLNTRQSQVITGCSYLPYDGAHQAMYVTTGIRGTNTPLSLLTRLLTPTSTTAPWLTVYGINAASLAATSYALTEFLDAGGHPYHYNVYGYYAALTMSGTGNASMCGTTCPANAQHQADAWITLPGGVGGKEVKTAALYNASLSAIAWDATAGCDTFFGDPNDNACKITVNKGQVQCLVSGIILTTAPQAPLPSKYWYSEDYVEFEGKFLMTGSYGVVVDGVAGWVSQARCYTPTQMCKFPTLPTCSEPYLTFTVIRVPGDKIGTDADANSQCAQGPFAVTDVYIPGDAESSCVTVTVDKHAQVPGDCI